MRKIRTYHEVDSDSGSTLVDQVVAQRDRLAQRLGTVASVVAVASGKGGVGKSAVTANLAAVLASRGLRVGALDADLNGPSLARMLGSLGETLGDGPDGVVPAVGAAGVHVMSMELLQGASDAPLRWKEPSSDRFIWQSALETGALREFLSDVAWGHLDFLVVDVPPGTDKIGRLLELVPGIDQLLLVCTPSEMSRAVVARSLTQVREAGVESVGLVANMTEYVCPGCGDRHPLFPGDGVQRLAREAGVDIWADVPFDPRMGASTDQGAPAVLAVPDSPASAGIRQLADRVVSAAKKPVRNKEEVEP